MSRLGQDVCKRDGMCDVYEEQWDARSHKSVCIRLPGTEWCLCPREASISSCMNSFLCLHHEVPATVLTEHQGRCKECADRDIFMHHGEALPRPCAHWECPGCRFRRRKVCAHPMCRLGGEKHVYCLDCMRQMLLVSRDGANRMQCPMCRPLFDMGKT